MTTRAELRRQRDDALTRAARSKQEADELREQLMYVTGSFTFDEYRQVGKAADGTS
ncbi:hypothetical protein P9139_18005 [Curtobacterium flaccumfaciens]|nr:hypothetical protein P9139_18005 [Curtobacterium flaccumfaciens]